MILWTKEQLNFLKSNYILYQNTNSNNVHSVSMEKLTGLWLNKRKKVISIIKNNGNLPNFEQFSISAETQEQCSSPLNKYVPKDSFINKNEEQYF